MSRNRFDHRSKDTFKKDIFFGTKVEKHFFNRWRELCEPLDYISIINPRNNGVCNEGKFIEKGKTSGADYMIDLCYHSLNTRDLPLEIKWVPTPGKFSLKEGDLKGYIREKAAILFIYNTNRSYNLRKPKGCYDYVKYIDTLRACEEDFKWGIMFPDAVQRLYQTYKNHNRIVPIYYMGGKPGLILEECDYSKWFTEEQWYAH